MDNILEDINEEAAAPRNSVQKLGRRKTWPKLVPCISGIIYWEDGETKEIGEGFFSKVYKFLHHPSGSTVVIKVSKEDDDESEEDDHAVMIKEIELLKKLNHQNIIKYLGLCAKDGRFHPVLEYINGGALDSLLVNYKIALSWSEKIGFCRDVAEGMRYLHLKHIFHRDLKSSNCLIRLEKGGLRSIVVADFGLAREVSGDTRCPRKMSVVGTAFWMAPELMKRKKCNSKVDVFSYGILACEILARVISDPDALPRTSNFGLDVEKFSAICQDCPRQLVDLVEDCTKVSNPFSRPSFDEIVQILEDIESAEDFADCDVIEELLLPDKDEAVTKQSDDKQRTVAQHGGFNANKQSGSTHDVMPQRYSNRSTDSGFGDCCATCSGSDDLTFTSEQIADQISVSEHKSSAKNAITRKKVSFRLASSILSGRRRFMDDVIYEDVTPSRGLSLKRSSSLPDLRQQAPENGRDSSRAVVKRERTKSFYFRKTDC